MRKGDKAQLLRGSHMIVETLSGFSHRRRSAAPKRIQIRLPNASHKHPILVVSHVWVAEGDSFESTEVALERTHQTISISSSNEVVFVPCFYHWVSILILRHRH